MYYVPEKNRSCKRSKTNNLKQTNEINTSLVTTRRSRLQGNERQFSPVRLQADLTWRSLSVSTLGSLKHQPSTKQRSHVDLTRTRVHFLIHQLLDCRAGSVDEHNTSDEKKKKVEVFLLLFSVTFSFSSFNRTKFVFFKF